MGGTNVGPICEASLKPPYCKIWSGSNNHVRMYHVFHWLANKKNIYHKK